MKIITTELQDALIIEPTVYGDDRGFFMETYAERDFTKALGGVSFVQDNHSRSTAGVLRGLHYQIKQPQGKLIRVVVGEVYDVIVDLRRSAQSFGHWQGFYLSANNKRQLWVPPGFAHGFYVASDIAEVVYKCSDYYAPEWERTLLWDDPVLAIDWPLVGPGTPLLSEKDQAGAYMADAELFA